MDEQRRLDGLDIETLFQAEIARELQAAREEYMGYQGAADLNKATAKAEERAYASHTVYGSIVRKQYTLEIAEELRRRYSELRKGKAGAGRSELMLLREQLDWGRIAYISLSTMLDMAGMPKTYGRLTKKDRKDGGLVTVSELNLEVGRRVMIEANLRKLRRTLPRKYAELKDRFFTEHAGFRQRITNIKRESRSLAEFFHDLAVGARTSSIQMPQEKMQEIAENWQWVDWSHDIVLQVGSLVARVVNDVTGFFSWTHSFDEKGKNRPLFVFSQVFDEVRDEVMFQSRGFASFMLPMLVPPKRWSQTEAGGYYASARALYDGIVRGYRKGTVISDMTYDFINHQQEVPFFIDKEILGIQRFLAEKGWSILGEVERDEDPNDAWRPYRAPDHFPVLPLHLQGVKKPQAGAPQEHVELYREKKRISQQIRDFHTRQEELKQRAKPVERYLRLVEMVENDPMFFFPWSLDWRGRCYPMVDALNPQGPEYQKAILNFGWGVPIDDRTDFWLCVGIASAAGQDKESFESRVAWTKRNLKLVEMVADDPLGRGFDTWTNMSEPWIFLRACIEWRRINREGQTFTNISCLGQDATQSGLQLLGGMVLDKQTCDLVNCVPGHDKPQDAYGTVLAEAIRLIEEDGSGFPIEKVKGKRKLVKTPVMTKVYAAGHDTRVGQIRRALNKEGIRLALSTERNEELIEYFTTKVEEAMVNTIPGVDLILEWFQRVVETAIKIKGVQDIRYETASGNLVVVEYREALTKRIATESLGAGVCIPAAKAKKSEDTKATIAVGRGETILEDVMRAVAANFTHGAGDAGLLQLAFHDAVGSIFASTHDCVYSPPSRIVDDNHKRVREAFIKICRSNSLQRFAELNQCQELPPPIVGTYNPETVRRARYFFC